MLIVQPQAVAGTSTLCPLSCSNVSSYSPYKHRFTNTLPSSLQNFAPQILRVPRLWPLATQTHTRPPPSRLVPSSRTTNFSMIYPSGSSAEKSGGSKRIWREAVRVEEVCVGRSVLYVLDSSHAA